MTNVMYVYVINSDHTGKYTQSCSTLITLVCTLILVQLWSHWYVHSFLFNSDHAGMYTQSCSTLITLVCTLSLVQLWSHWYVHSVLFNSDHTGMYTQSCSTLITLVNQWIGELKRIFICAFCLISLYVYFRRREMFLSIFQLDPVAW